MDLHSKPLLVFWEMTGACTLACKHCRAKAKMERDRDELAYNQFFDQVMQFGAPYPHVILTGGDPMMRPDLMEAAKYAHAHGISTSVSFSGTTLVTEKVVEEFSRIGVSSISISIDGPDRETHDRFRGINGVYDSSVKIIEMLKKYGMPFQINTTVRKGFSENLPAMFSRVHEWGASRWDLFFIVPTGRAPQSMLPDPGETEDILSWLIWIGSNYSLPVRTTAALHFRRVEMEKKGGGSLYQELVKRTTDLVKTEKVKVKAHAAMLGLMDGNGIIFVSRNGTIYPSGFLPLPLGNIKEENLADVYRQSPVLIKIRSRVFSGKCGRCSYREVCGGSRARAYAITGDYMGSDPLCIHEE